ncbi:MAG: hypothetical protein QMD65_02215 [Patescibacteria group bacterium]|nr:hypothetical protein [Patescibacteria group bacterium]
MIIEIFRHLVDLLIEFLRKEEVWILLVLFAIVGTSFISLSDFLPMIWHYFLMLWWFWLFIILFPVFGSIYQYYRQEVYKRSFEFVLLEVKMPREIIQSPQAMEQVFAAIHSLRNSVETFKDKYLNGVVTCWFSLEIINLAGENEIHFFVRTPAQHRNVVEAAFFSYYPDIEVQLVDDYVVKLPSNVKELEERDLDAWGAEMVLAKEEAYPIKTFPYFESQEEERQIDPISNFLEVLGKTKKDETVGIQILIAPAGSSWKDKWEKLVIDLQKPTTIPIKPKTEGGPSEMSIGRSPGKNDILEAVERNLSKPAFDTLIRLIYMAPRPTFFESFAKGGLVSAFNQYTALNFNSFKLNSAAGTQSSPVKNQTDKSFISGWASKNRFLYNFIHREMPPGTWAGYWLGSSFSLNTSYASRRFAINIEGLATLFHPPTAMVLTAPHIRRVESRKTGPPAGLAIFGEEDELERFQ